MNGDLVALAVHLLDGRVVAVLVRDEEGRLDVATVWIFALAIEDLLVEANVVVVDGVVEGDGDHLGHVLGWQIAGNGRAVLGTVAVGQDADDGIAGWRPVGVAVHV